MSPFFRRVESRGRALKDSMTSNEYVVSGRPVRCPHCGGKKFARTQAILNTRKRLLMKFEWTGTAAMLICVECRRIEWFARTPELLEDSIGKKLGIGED